jgi:thioredoxin reductase
MLEWLIIGGGIHGTYLSRLLTGVADVGPDDIRVLDPHDHPLALWRRHAARCGMAYLRSPAAHNIDIDIRSVYRFAKTEAGQPYADFIPLYFRPSLELFNRHCADVIQKHGLDRLRIRGRARAIRRSGTRFIVATGDAPITTRRVILAIGLTEQLHWPTWAAGCRDDGGAIAHVFEPGFRRRDIPSGATVVIVGGGLTAVQTALALGRSHTGSLTLLSRRTLTASGYDFDPCWIGPKCMGTFLSAETDVRRTIIARERCPGTLPQEVFDQVTRTAEGRRIQQRIGCVLSAARLGDGIELTLSGETISADRIILATGFDPVRPGGVFVNRLVGEFGLKTHACGYPIVGDDLQWGENIFVVGPLAELRVGPCARNIIGARNAGRLLLAARI